MINTQTRVVLPGWCFKGTNQEEIKKNVLKYINPKCYPGYRVLKVSKGFAICERAM
ncbi:hypothetical protein C174_01594 [Bacillus mycoides FSL H7-687]|nr:hypothetical protein C174_01594 [Bacillus mycoides FSL H7-687]